MMHTRLGEISCGASAVGALLEPAVECDLFGSQTEPRQLARRVGQQPALGRVARSRGGRQDEPPAPRLVFYVTSQI